MILGVIAIVEKEKRKKKGETRKEKRKQKLEGWTISWQFLEAPAMRYMVSEENCGAYMPRVIAWREMTHGFVNLMARANGFP